MNKKYTIIAVLIIFILTIPAQALSNNTTRTKVVAASSAVIPTNASGSAVVISVASGASGVASYKYYDKPWLMAEPPKELTLNEYQIGVQAQKGMADLPIVASSPYQAKLEKIVAEIASVTPRPYIPYTVKVVQNDQMNAFTVPGGAVYVYTGLLDKVESDDELAGVLAHEIAHNVRFHVLRKIHDSEGVTNAAFAARVASIIGVLAGDRTGASQALGTVAGVIATAIMSESSIPLETEADEYGYQYITKTHYNPVGFLTFMEKLAAGFNQESEKHAGIYMTHPFSKDRVAKITEYLNRDKIDIPAGRRKVLRVHSAQVKEYKLENGELSYIVTYNKINLLLFGYNKVGKARAEELATGINNMLDKSIEPYNLSSRKNPKTVKIVYKNQILYELSDADMQDNLTTDMGAMADSLLSKLKQVIWDDGIVIHRTEIL